MGLDIRFASRRDVLCPHCKGVVATEDVYSVCSGGREWYDILEQLGYYVPHDQRTEENDWYGEDMVLTHAQAKQLYEFVKKNSDLYNARAILVLISSAFFEGNAVVINADW